MRLIQYISEKAFRDIFNKPGKWVFLNNKGHKSEVADNLVDLVQTAYRGTKLGSFVNNKNDVMASHYWEALDHQDDPDANAVLFGRKARPKESWTGIKIQGIGHDGERASIEDVMVKLVKVLKKPSYWIEASGSIEHVLYKRGTPYLKDEETIQKIFPNSDVKLTGEKGKYERTLKNGQIIVETIFGSPKI